MSTPSQQHETPLHVVLGASGGIGAAVVRELATRGLRVRAVNRGGNAPVPDGVERHAADVTTADGARTATAGATVVHHCAQPNYTRWHEELPAMNRTIAAATAAAGAKLVVADNLYMYGGTNGPMSEDSPQTPSSRKGRLRRDLARDLLDLHDAGTLRVTLGRAGSYYGPGGTNTLAGTTLFGAALRGQPMRWPGNVDVPHVLHHLPDIARGLVTLGLDERADGAAWVLPAGRARTPREFTALVAQAAGRPMRLVPTSKTMMRIAGLFVPPAREIPDIWEQHDRPWTVDATRFQRTFGPLTTTTAEEGVPPTVAWYRHHLNLS